MSAELGEATMQPEKSGMGSRRDDVDESGGLPCARASRGAHPSYI